MICHAGSPLFSSVVVRTPLSDEVDKGSAVGFLTCHMCEEGLLSSIRHVRHTAVRINSFDPETSMFINANINNIAEDDCNNNITRCW